RQMFESALGVPPERRREFLEAASNGNATLVEVVLRMLAADERSTGLFDRASSNSISQQEFSQVCSSCRAAVSETDRFCRSCGTPTDDNSIGHEGRFRAGTLFAQRFRIVALLGRGGMGDVYRAHDLELDQPVALKFLTGFRVYDRARARLRNE